MLDIESADVRYLILLFLNDRYIGFFLCTLLVFFSHTLALIRYHIPVPYYINYNTAYS